MSEVRFYKGKYKVEVVLKSQGNWRVKALEEFTLPKTQVLSEVIFGRTVLIGETFTTIPRLLWRHKRISKQEMNIDDLEFGKCPDPECSGDLIEREDGSCYCEVCGWEEDE